MRNNKINHDLHTIVNDSRDNDTNISGDLNKRFDDFPLDPTGDVDDFPSHFTENVYYTRKGSNYEHDVWLKMESSGNFAFRDARLGASLHFPTDRSNNGSNNERTVAAAKDNRKTKAVRIQGG